MPQQRDRARTREAPHFVFFPSAFRPKYPQKLIFEYDRDLGPVNPAACALTHLLVNESRLKSAPGGRVDAHHLVSRAGGIFIRIMTSMGHLQE